MKASRIFTRQIMGLDYRVFHVILGMIILSIGLLSYRLIDVKKCTPVNFLIKTINIHTDSSYQTGETLSFIASPSSNDITWDFGDNSDKITGQFVTHKFVNTGSFQIKASTGTTCETVQVIVIKASTEPTQKGNYQVTGNEIVGPVSTVAGSKEAFTCMVAADSYEWSMVNYPKMIRKGSTANFEFPVAGKFVIQVTLDNDRTKRYTREITVEPAEKVSSTMPNIKPLLPESMQPLPNLVSPASETQGPATVKISDAVFTEYLEKVIDKKMTTSEFDKYLCYQGETKVVLNGDLMNFKELCEEISGKKRRKMIIAKTRIKIKSAIMRRDNDGCVNIIEVKYH